MDNAVLISPSFDAVIRAGIQMVAGYLVTAAHLDPTQITTISGVLLGFVSIAWSIWHKQANAA